MGHGWMGHTPQVPRAREAALEERDGLLAPTLLLPVSGPWGPLIPSEEVVMVPDL